MSVCDEHDNPNATPSTDSFLLSGDPVRRSANRDPSVRQKALVELGRRAINPPKLEMLVQDAISLLAEMLKTEMVLMAEIAADGSSLGYRMTKLASPDTEGQSWSSTASLAGNQSLSGFVLETMRPVVVVDLAREDRFCDSALHRFGMQSAVAAPLSVGESAFGVLAACSDLPARFDDDDMLFVESVAQLIAASIARAKAERRLAEERQLSNDLFKNVDALILVLDCHGHILRINPACERITAFSLADVVKRQFCDAFAMPEDADQIIGAIQQAADGVSANLETRLLTKQGQIRKITWKFAAVGNREAVMATGLDVTHKRELESQVQVYRDAEAEAATKLAAAATFPTERRRRPRRSYPFPQKVGYVFDNEMPEKSHFIEVLCHDIGPGGFSYLSPCPPPSSQVVVALGTAPHITCMTARVVHYKRVTTGSDLLYLVGCYYTGRAIY